MSGTPAVLAVNRTGFGNHTFSARWTLPPQGTVATKPVDPIDTSASVHAWVGRAVVDVRGAVRISESSDAGAGVSTNALVAHTSVLTRIRGTLQHLSLTVNTGESC